MGYDSAKHHRRSIRLAYHDYADYGWYFVTVCAIHEKQVFGRVEDSCVRLNAYREVVAEEWPRLIAHPPFPVLDAWIVMPNHVHGIVVITSPSEPASDKPPVSLGNLIRNFKSSVTRHINDQRAERGLPIVQVWQRNYYEHLVRDEADLWRVRQYIAENPVYWTEDDLYTP